MLVIYERFKVVLYILLMPLLALSAVFINLWMTGIELNISAMMGMMIVGIVTEVAIFFFSEYFNLPADIDPREALVE